MVRPWTASARAGSTSAIPAGATAVHGISDADVADAPTMAGLGVQAQLGVDEMVKWALR